MRSLIFEIKEQEFYGKKDAKTQFIIDKKFLPAIATVVSLISALFGFALSKNTETIIFVLIPVFSLLLSVANEKNYEKVFSKFNAFFKKRMLLFLLTVTFVAAYPLVIGFIPYEDEFFSKITFIIFRQE